MALRGAVAALAVLTAAPRPLLAQRAEAIRAPAGALRLDGRLDEALWQQAAAVTDFVQREPVEGAPATYRTEVRFAYDDGALWIGARMFSAEPGEIRALVTRRDREGSSEQLVVSFDTYRDRRTAYSFGVTPAGVRIDYYHDSDFEGSRDYGWDPVWEVETATDDDGWTAELRIPFAQLRFSNAPEQIWGLNVTRQTPARNEVSYWVLVRRNETGWASRMGELAGLRDVRPSRGIEALPYVAASASVLNGADPGNPLFDDRTSAVRAGGDLKIGLGPSLTLDATFNPDFGQVEADPAEVNLTAFETFFAERRPFFLENAQLFAGRGLFYSRRIGAQPPIEPDADHFETIENTTILGAAKLAGRLASGLSVGALTALTDRETVATYDEAPDSFGRAVVAPRTGYAVLSLQQEFGADASTFKVLVTGVRRDLEEGTPLAAALTETAISGIVDTRIRWAGGKYDVSAYVGGTHVRGSPEALLLLQQSSRRYWQRPDAPHVDVDPARTSMTGTMLGINHSRMAGTHWLWDIDYYQESPGLEPNDIGSLGGADDRGLIADMRYRETDPGRLFRSWVVGAGQVTEWTFGGERQYTVVFPYANFTFPNFWRLNLDGELVLAGVSDALTRGGPLMQQPRSRFFGVELQNSAGARTRWGIEASLGSDDAGGRSFRIEPSLSFRPGTRLELSVDPRWIDREDARQFVAARDGGSTATFGRRYIFAHVERSEVAARVRLNYTFTPNLSLETHLEPFASSGSYHSFGELRAARSGDLRTYGEEGTAVDLNADGSRTITADGESFTIGPRDFNVRSLRSNAVLRWEWRPGSTAYLVWQQNAFADRDPGTVRPGHLLDAFDAGADHYLALKVSYWLPVR
ncbi:MAG TPA: DUF5916 domain-containing protein [Longimicrobiales bacterium]